MKRKDLPFMDWGITAIAEGRKTLTSRCSGLAAVNRNPDEWTYGGLWECNLNPKLFTQFHRFVHKSGSVHKACCPWMVGVVYPPANVRVTKIVPKRVQDMTDEEAQAEGIAWVDNSLGICQWKGLGGERGWHDYVLDAFAEIWDSIHRRDVNNRFSRNPWRWEIAFEKTEMK